MIFEFVIKHLNASLPSELKRFHWVKKRDDLVSFFVFNERDKKRLIKSIHNKFSYNEYVLEGFNSPLSVADDYFFDGFLFTNQNHGKKSGKNIISISTTKSFGFDHPATLLVLKKIALHKKSYDDKRVLDLGSGSGILSIYMVKTGCKKAYALDIDPFAVFDAKKNAKLNKLGKRKIKVILRDISTLKEPFDFIVANVPINVHYLVSADVNRLLKYGGGLVAGGFFHSKLEDIVKIYGGLTLKSSISDGEWGVAVFEK